MTTKRVASADDKATNLGWRVEHSDAGHRIVDASSGTLVAAAWDKPDGYGLTLDEVNEIVERHSS